VKAATRRVLKYIVAAYLAFGIIFAAFMYSQWSNIPAERWFDLAVGTAIIFAAFVPPLGRDIRKPKVFALLLLFYVGHLVFCLHFLTRGIYLRPLAYAPIAVGEVFMFTYLLIWLGGAKYEDFRESLTSRRKR
jgi:hypothetical protein